MIIMLGSHVRHTQKCNKKKLFPKVKKDHMTKIRKGKLRLN